MEDEDVALGVSSDVGGKASVRQRSAHRVLENGPRQLDGLVSTADTWRAGCVGRRLEEGRLVTYSNTDRHAQAAHEPVHAGSHRTVLFLGNGLVGDSLRCDVDACQYHTVPHAEHREGEGEDRLPSALIEDGEQAAGDERDAPAQPDGPSKVPEARSKDGYHDRAGDKETDGGEEIEAGTNRRRAAHRHLVEGHIVEACEELDVGQHTSASAKTGGEHARRGR